MRLIIIIHLALLITQPVLSQQPTKEQMQAQMKQAKLEAQQQIAELEKEIADAKKKGEYPETIKDLENQLATLKKMLGVVDKAAGISDKKPRNIEVAQTKNIPPYKSPYIRFFTQPVVIPTAAQTKDRLLWYHGKKINKNTLITTKGRIIQYDKKNNRILVQYNEKNDSNAIKITNNLTKSRQWTNSYVNKVSAEKNSFFDYPLVMMTMKEFDLIEQELKKFTDELGKTNREGLLDSPAVIRVMYDSNLIFDTDPKTGSMLVTENPDYIRKDLPAHIPQFIIFNWKWSPDFYPAHKPIEKIFLQDFPIEKIQAMIDN